MRRRRSVLLALAATPVLGSHAQESGFDHSHAAWTALLQRHVLVLRGGQASQLRYAALAADHGALRSYLAAMSAVSAAQFDAFGKERQQAFLINAYNAFTVELVLTRYPALKSIKDLGSFLSSPWKPAWIPLLGRQLSLDGIEHDLLRRRGAYDEPRVHFAVNCASVGCPMLREEAYVAERLDVQLAQQTRRFLADRTRNRWNAARGRLELSKIFDWYGDDFRQGHQGITSVAGLAARHADVLADAPADQERIRRGAEDIGFLDYDWSLNDAR